MGRLRTNPEAQKLIKNYSNYIDLDKFIIPNKPLELEIGCGKGNFLIEKSKQSPGVFFLGVEKYSTVILKALKKIQTDQIKLNNLLFTCGDAKQLNVEKFKNTISKIYLNFSDPWPKKRHAKRRLTSPSFLDIYKIILKPIGNIEFKTDNKELYLYTLDILKNRNDVCVIYWTNDLYNNLSNKFNQSNIQTEYEKKFVKLNKKIHKIIWKYN